MTDTLWGISIAAGLGIVATTSIGVKVLRHFSHRQLHVYCRARQRRELFHVVLETHDDVAMSVEKLQMTSVVLLGGCVAVRLTDYHLERSPLAIAAAVAGIVVLLFLPITVWVPWAVTRHWSGPFLLRTWWLWRLIHRLFLPFSLGGRLFDSLFHRLTGQPKKADKEQEEEDFEDEIMTMVTVGERDGYLEADAKEMIEGVMELGDDDVADIMTPRREVDALEVDWDWPEIISYVNACGRTRLPVYEGNLDKIVGVLYVKDLLPELVKEPGKRAAPSGNWPASPGFFPRRSLWTTSCRTFARIANTWRSWSTSTRPSKEL